MAGRYRGMLFDLFGTVITFDAGRLPELTVLGERVRSTVGGLGDRLADWVPDTSPAEFWRALMTVSETMARVRAEDHVELPSRERFRRALELVGCEDERMLEAAVDLSRAHMAMIVHTTVLPPGHRGVLEAARARGPVALVSNFDDTGSVYDILRRHGIIGYFDTVVVSEAVGLRKPEPALVRIALRSLELDPTDALLVGDTFEEDVAAARGAGVDTAWIDRHGSGVPSGASPPTYVLRALTDVLPILEGP